MRWEISLRNKCRSQGSSSLCVRASTDKFDLFPAVRLRSIFICSRSCRWNNESVRAILHERWNGTLQRRFILSLQTRILWAIDWRMSETISSQPLANIKKEKTLQLHRWRWSNEKVFQERGMLLFEAMNNEKEKNNHKKQSCQNEEVSFPSLRFKWKRSKKSENIDSLSNALSSINISVARNNEKIRIGRKINNFSLSTVRKSLLLVLIGE